jgi:nicotinamide-nucleotide amidase
MPETGPSKIPNAEPSHGARAERDDAAAYIYDPSLEARARDILAEAHGKGLSIATAESCTGGSLSALLTDVEGFSHVFDRGFAVYCDAAKRDCLEIDPELLKLKGAVSAEVARAMADGALRNSDADLAVAITGNAGPAGPDDETGLVYLCALARDGQQLSRTCHFGEIGRSQTRIKAIETALTLLAKVCENAERQRDE